MSSPQLLRKWGHLAMPSPRLHPKLAALGILPRFLSLNSVLSPSPVLWDSRRVSSAGMDVEQPSLTRRPCHCSAALRTKKNLGPIIQQAGVSHRSGVRKENETKPLFLSVAKTPRFGQGSLEQNHSRDKRGLVTSEARLRFHNVTLCQRICKMVESSF